MTAADKKEIQAYIDAAIQSTIQGLKAQGIISPDAPLRLTTSRLHDYYKNDMQDADITRALERLKEDRYIDIIPLYYYSHNTIEHIASLYDVDVSTITRNKKRLCKEISKIIYG